MHYIEGKVKSFYDYRILYFGDIDRTILNTGGTGPGVFRRRVSVFIDRCCSIRISENW